MTTRTPRPNEPHEREPMNEIERARELLARPKVEPELRGGTGRLADVIGVEAVEDYFKRLKANRVLLAHYASTVPAASGRHTRPSRSASDATPDYRSTGAPTMPEYNIVQPEPQPVPVASLYRIVTWGPADPDSSVFVVANSVAEAAAKYAIACGETQPFTVSQDRVLS